MTIPDFAQGKTEIEGRSYLENDLSYGVGYHIRGTRQTGSDQHFEVDTFVHAGASSPYVFNGIYNVLSDANSHVGDARAAGAGGDVRGAIDLFRVAPCHVEVHDAGRVDDLRCFEATYAGDNFGRKESFVDRDHASHHVLAGTTEQVDVLAFSNGWSISVDGDGLQLRDGRGAVSLRP
jgi:hypothetical protein